MSNQPMIDADPLAIKPIIEALIFASDEPLSARSLIKLLAGENARPSDRVPPLLRMIEDAAPEADSVQEGEDGVEGPDVDDEPVTEHEVTGTEVETPDDEPPVDDQPDNLSMVDTLPVEPHVSHDNDSGGPVIDHMRRGGISLVVEDSDIADGDFIAKHQPPCAV